MNLSALTASPPSARPRRRRPYNCPRELVDADAVRCVHLDQLKHEGFPHTSLPLDVSIRTTAIEDGHAVYNVTITSRTTPHSWVVSYRYRQFLCLKQRVVANYTCRSAQCSGSCAAIRAVLETLFPRQRLVSSVFPYVTQERARAFEKVLRYLLGCVLLPGSAMKCLKARGGVTVVVFQFLHVQDPLDQRTLLQVFADTHTHEATKPATAATECIICLEAVNQSDVEKKEDSSTETRPTSGAITLPCHHAFHRECLFEWLVVEHHCPMCRSRVGPQAVAQFCIIEKTITQLAFEERSTDPTTCSQWWLEEFAQDPLH